MHPRQNLTKKQSVLYAVVFVHIFTFHAPQRPPLHTHLRACIVKAMWPWLKCTGIAMQALHAKGPKFRLFRPRPVASAHVVAPALMVEKRLMATPIRF